LRDHAGLGGQCSGKMRGTLSADGYAFGGIQDGSHRLKKFFSLTTHSDMDIMEDLICVKDIG